MSEDKPIVCFDATELDDFELCKFRWYARHTLHLLPKEGKKYFDEGSLLHYFLELYYKCKKELGQMSAANLEMIIEQGRIKSLEFNLNLEEVAEIVFQFREYVRYYEDENIIPIIIEEPFLVELFEDEDLKVLLSGKPDLIFRYGNSHTSEVSVMDHKKVSREFDISPLRNQFLLYATAIGTDTVIVNKIGFQKTKSPKDRFLRKPFIYPKEILEEWKSDVINRAREMVISQTYDQYRRNRTSCEKWNGCYLQRYCSTRPKAREFLIGSEYIVGEAWDVSKKLETKGE